MPKKLRPGPHKGAHYINHIVDKRDLKEGGEMEDDEESDGRGG